ncbi:hypothetical protein ILYODFUR_018889 [Ilyodon furcidens]|uniref:Uncharacterized protein n=1 Tax=Ilyodon furcidens TaxID=33524 RepID=A0ABV0TB34_9TELE
MWDTALHLLLKGHCTVFSCSHKLEGVSFMHALGTFSVFFQTRHFNHNIQLYLSGDITQKVTSYYQFVSFEMHLKRFVVLDFFIVTVGGFRLLEHMWLRSAKNCIVSFGFSLARRGWRLDEALM